jgi:DNA-binding transcriptional ArsR family regulator
MLRIFFTTEDIARVRLRATPDPLWELVLSLHMLRGQPGDLLFSQWRRQAAKAVSTTWAGIGGRLMNDLIPTMGYFPDFLNPAEAAGGLETGLEAIRSTPITVLNHDLQRVRAPRRSAAAVRLLATGDVGQLTGLTAAMQAYYAAAIGPYQPLLRAAAERESRIRMHYLANGGVREMLSSLRPMVGFSDGELRVPGHPDQVIHLNGRGITLVPSYFCVRHPVTLFDGELPPVLIYPSARDQLALLPPAPTQHKALTALIGATRAAILTSLGSGSTTMDLAARLDISGASASEHASVLRNAGLVVSHRDGARVIHQITALGLSLLEPPGDAGRPHR